MSEEVKKEPLTFDEQNLITRIKQRVYLDSDEEIMSWIRSFISKDSQSEIEELKRTNQRLLKSKANREEIYNEAEDHNEELCAKLKTLLVRNKELESKLSQVEEHREELITKLMNAEDKIKELSPKEEEQDGFIDKIIVIYSKWANNGDVDNAEKEAFNEIKSQYTIIKK